MGHDRVLWILQWVFGLYFIAVGIMHFIVPEGLPEIMSWMYDLSDTLHLVSGTAEILGGLGLILPGLTRIRPELTPLAAVGLIVVMVSAIIWHLGREEFTSIGGNVVSIVALSYIAYGRWRLAPLAHRSRINTL
jgi:putative oxidoreductase